MINQDGHPVAGAKPNNGMQRTRAPEFALSRSARARRWCQAFGGSVN